MRAVAEPAARRGQRGRHHRVDQLTFFIGRASPVSPGLRSRWSAISGRPWARRTSSTPSVVSPAARSAPRCVAVAFGLGVLNSLVEPCPHQLRQVGLPIVLSPNPPAGPDGVADEGADVTADVRGTAARSSSRFTPAHRREQGHVYPRWLDPAGFAAAAVALLVVAPATLSQFRLELLAKYLCFAIVAVGTRSPGDVAACSPSGGGVLRPRSLLRHAPPKAADGTCPTSWWSGGDPATVWRPSPTYLRL